MNEQQKKTMLEQLLTDNEGKLQDIHAKNYIGTDDDMPDNFDNWISNLELSEVCELLNINVDANHYEDMKQMYE